MIAATVLIQNFSLIGWNFRQGQSVYRKARACLDQNVTKVNDLVLSALAMKPTSTVAFCATACDRTSQDQRVIRPHLSSQILLTQFARQAITLLSVCPWDNLAI